MKYGIVCAVLRTSIGNVLIACVPDLPIWHCNKVVMCTGAKSHKAHRKFAHASDKQPDHLLVDVGC